MKTLLVPTDFYEASLNALSYAAALARAMEAKITLLHAYQTFPSSPVVSEKRQRREAALLEKEAEEKLKQLCAGIEPAQHCRCDFLNVEGPAKECIVEYARKLKPELLIMGTRKRKPLDKALFGTLTAKVLKEVLCATLVVPQSPAYTPPLNLAFAIDYHDSDVEDIRFMAGLAGAFRAKLSLLHIVTDEEDPDLGQRYFQDFQRSVKQTLPEENLVFRLIRSDDLHEAIRKYVAAEGIDLLAVSRTSKNALERLLLGSTSQKLFNRLSIPLLVFQARDKPANF